MKIIVNGGNFSNKGAQAMLFVVVCTLREQFPDCDILYTRYYGDTENVDFTVGSIKRGAFLSKLRREGGMNPIYTFMYWLEGIAVEIIKTKNVKSVLTGNCSIGNLGDIVCIVDISGFALSSKFPMRNNRNYLDMIEYSNKCGIPMILMPQSFGPFDYKKSKDKTVRRIERVLNYPKLIFAREKEGYDLLKNRFHLTNVRFSNDLVLQSRKFNFSSLFKKELDTSDNMVKQGSVAMIPNRKVLLKANAELNVYDIYSKIVKMILGNGHDIYLIWHSSEDKSICKNIKELYSKEERVHFVGEELNCYEYDKIVGKFNYIVASRFHSIVMAYRKGVPAVGIGWAVKYQELFELCSQESYMVDINAKEATTDILNAISSMEGRYQEESRRIAETIERVQSYSCLDQMVEVIHEEIEDR